MGWDPLGYFTLWPGISKPSSLLRHDFASPGRGASVLYNLQSQQLQLNHQSCESPLCWTGEGGLQRAGASTSVHFLPEGLRHRGVLEGRSCLGNPVREREKRKRWHFCQGVLQRGSQTATRLLLLWWNYWPGTGRHPKTKETRNQSESGKCVFVHSYRDETEEEKGILKAQLYCFDGATTVWLKDWPYIYMYIKICYADKT